MDMIYKDEQRNIIEQQHVLSDGSVLPLLHFPLFSDISWLRHCFTTREGGCSRGIYESLNLSFTRGDDPQAVRENYEKVADYFETDVSHMVTSDQTHTTNLRVVTARDGGKGILYERDYRDIDGMITCEPGLVLATFYADCVPLYFVDIRTRTIALSHSGWKGTRDRMAQKTIRAMADRFGTQPEDLYCAIGPSICQDCYEVDGDVAEPFIETLGADAPVFVEDIGGEKYHLDLWGINRRWLLEAGVPAQQIAVAGLCTCCNRYRLFSHRGLHGKRGNLGAFLMIEGERKQ